jgi:DNA-binding GntR family transcriptional regulator
MRVAELTARDVDELFGLRDLLERYAMELALSLPDSRSLVGLTTAFDAMAAAVRTGDAFGENEAHRQFHIEVVALTGQRQLLMTFEPVILKLQLYMAANLRREAERRAPAEAIERHRKLLEAIASGDLPTVLAVLATHGARTYIG